MSCLLVPGMRMKNECLVLDLILQCCEVWPADASRSSHVISTDYSDYDLQKQYMNMKQVFDDMLDN